mmetsp:Transcript_6555/g.7131  ORF Transcript_6555/g.7131 Transcript_6555/m.7131 type:complete len:312 (+) Transcript_6555:89-1024(+)
MSCSGIISLKGVKLSFLEHFIDKCGGLARFEGKTTGDVVKSFILRSTENFQSSYCDYLARDGNDCFTGKANVFISHAWSDSFLELYNKLLDKANYRERLSKNPNLQYEWKNELIVWIDIFSMNQHSEEIRNADWLKTTFANAIKEIGFTLFIFTPKSITRMWCIWEIYCTIKMSKLSVATTNSSEITQKIFLNEIGINSINGKCHLPDDERLLKELIAETGFDQVNNTIRKSMLSDLLHSIPTCFQSLVLRLEGCYVSDNLVPEAFSLRQLLIFLALQKFLISCANLLHALTLLLSFLVSHITGLSSLQKF